MSKRFGMIQSEISGLYVPMDSWRIYNFRGMKNEYDCMRIVNVLNDLHDMRIEKEELVRQYLKENRILKTENDRLHNKIFQMRTNSALDRTENVVSNQTYTTNEFLEELDKW